MISIGCPVIDRREGSIALNVGKGTCDDMCSLVFYCFSMPVTNSIHFNIKIAPQFCQTHHRGGGLIEIESRRPCTKCGASN